MNLLRDLIAEHGSDTQGLRWAVAGKLYHAHHASAGQDAPPLTDRPRSVKVRWLHRADVLIRRVREAV